jgi:NitT/TauT family transport system permease protein
VTKEAVNLIKGNKQTVLQVSVVILFLLAWEFGCRYFKVPFYLIPVPSTIGVRFYESTVDHTLLRHGWVTISEIALGFSFGAIAGFVLGMIFAEFEPLRVMMNPFIMATQVTPKTALAPLFIIWFGFGIASKVFIVALIAFFPVLVNTVAGVRSVDAEKIELMRTYGANRLKIIWYVKLPAAFPNIFAGLEVAAVTSVLGAIIGEFVGSKSGLGRLILMAGERLDMGLVFSSILVLLIIGAGIQVTGDRLKKRLFFWVGR